MKKYNQFVGRVKRVVQKFPRGAKLLRKPVRRKIGGWVEMIFDAIIVYRGISWYRTQHGFNGEHGSHPREDWCADLPEICVGAHRYLNDMDGRGRPVFGKSSFDPKEEPGTALLPAFDLAIKEARERLKHRQAEASALQERLAVTTKRLLRAKRN